MEVTILAGKGFLLRLCGGSILDNEHVLTAAHCVVDRTTQMAVAPKDVTVRAGVSDPNAPLVEQPSEKALGVNGIRVAHLAILGIETQPMPSQVKAVNLVLHRSRGKR